MNDIEDLHKPVMLTEAIDALAICPDGCYLDGTFGRGGHSKEILRRLGPEGFLLAMDKDPSAVASPEACRLLEDPRFGLAHASFAELLAWLSDKGMAGKVNGILLDLGVSSPQLDEARRGFSFLRDGPLDMRMDNSQGPTAAEWLDRAGESEITMVLTKFGEERFAKRIAKAIIQSRPVTTTRQLAGLIEQAVPFRERHKHPATRSFQAIRIALNRELADLEEGLRQAVEALAPGGRLVVISFHSLEDRIVKRFVREQECGSPARSRLPLPVEHRATLKAVGRAQMPTEPELRTNPRARSAVLRVAERVAG